MSITRNYYGNFDNFNFGDFSHCVEIQRRVDVPSNNITGSQKIEFETVATINVFWEDLKPIEAVAEGEITDAQSLVARNIKNACIVMPYRKNITVSDTWFLYKETGVRYKLESIDDVDKKRRYLKLFLIEKGNKNILGSEL